jgi:uncharacterized membrane protein
MQVINFFKMNNWKIKKFIFFVFLIQFILWGSISLDYIGLKIPILRQFIGFFYLTFLPGIIILRILRLHKLNTTETLLFAVGLSIASSMFVGLFMNMVYPFFGLLKPISNNLIIITLSIFIFLLTFLSYLRDKEFSEKEVIDTKNFLHPISLLLYILPFLAILGTYLMNYYNNNIILMIMILLISLVVLYFSFSDNVPKEIYPLGIFIISLSLLYLTWLTSTYMWGRDVHSELYFSNLVLNNLYWDKTIPDSTNAMLIVTLFAPMLSDICNLNSTWVYKVLFPILFSLIPLGLYELVRKQIKKNKIAFLSSFFFVSIYFYNILLSTVKQLFAEFFIILLVLLIVEKEKNDVKSILIIIFIISLVLSHYGTSYIFLITVLLVLLMMSLTKNKLLQRSTNYFSFKFRKFRFRNSLEHMNLFIGKNVFNANLALFFIVFCITWYMYVSNSCTFYRVADIGNHIINSMYTDILNPQTAQGLALLSLAPKTLWGYLHKYLILLTQFFIFIGVSSLVLLKKDYTKFKKEFVMFSIANFLLLIFSIIIPNFSSQLYTPRLYQITLLFLAPCCVIGGITFLMFFKKNIKNNWLNKIWTLKNSLKILSIIFVTIFLFEVGFINEIEKDHSYIPLSKDFMNSSNSSDRAYFYQDFNVFPQDISGANWFSNKSIKNQYLYSDIITQYVYSYNIQFGNNSRVLVNFNKLNTNSYLYLGYHNVVGKVLIFDRNKVYYTDSDVNMEKMGKINYLLDNLNRIYSNGGCDIYFS